MTKTKKMKIEIKSCREISGKKETARTVSVTECTFLFFLYLPLNSLMIGDSLICWLKSAYIYLVYCHHSVSNLEDMKWQ